MIISKGCNILFIQCIAIEQFFRPSWFFLAPSDSLDVISGFIHLVFHDSKLRYWTSLEACRLMLSYWSYQFRIICMSVPLLQLLIVVAKSSSFRGGSVHDDAFDMFLYTALLTGSSLLHLTNITYVHNDQKYINVCLSVEGSPKDGLEKGNRWWWSRWEQWQGYPKMLYDRVAPFA